MFKHLLFYSLKDNLRIKTVIFWNLIFPIVLSTFLSIALNGIQNSDKIRKTNIYVENSEIKKIYQNISRNEDIINIVNSNNPEKDILDGKIDAIVKGQKNLKIILGDNIVEDLIAYQISNAINKNMKLIELAIEANRGENIDKIIDSSSNYKSHLENAHDLSNKNYINGFFYTVLGMVSLSSMSYVVNNLDLLDINSKHGISRRLMSAPKSRFSFLAAVMLSTFLITIGQLILVTIYIDLVLKAGIFTNLFIL